MELSIILISLFLSAFFSGSEIAFVSANKLSIEILKKRKGLRPKILKFFYDRPKYFLGSMLIGNNIALVVFTTLMTIPLNKFFQNSLGINSEIILLLSSTIIITLIVLIFGEFLPKTIFRTFAADIIFLFAFPLRIIQLILAFPSWLMTTLSSLMMKLFFNKTLEDNNSDFTRTDLESFIRDVKSIEKQEIDKDLFGKALNLVETKVRACMVPRPEIEAIEINESIESLLKVFESTNLSRIIVYEGEIDKVVGYVHHQQLLKEPKSIRSILREIKHVPWSMLITDLMNDFIKNRLNIACVFDEFGGVAGIITLEDMMEELFGEIEDEHDQEEYIESEVSEDEYLFSGRLEIDYLNEKYELNLPVRDDDYHTLSGYLTYALESIPEKNSVIQLGNYRYKIEMVSNTKIDLVRVFRVNVDF